MKKKIIIANNNIGSFNLKNKIVKEIMKDTPIVLYEKDKSEYESLIKNLKTSVNVIKD